MEEDAKPVCIQIMFGYFQQADPYQCIYHQRPLGGREEEERKKWKGGREGGRKGELSSLKSIPRDKSH